MAIDEERVKKVFSDAFSIKKEAIAVSQSRDQSFANLVLKGFDVTKDPDSLRTLTIDLRAEVSVTNGSTNIKISTHSLNQLLNYQEVIMEREASKTIKRNFTDQEFAQIQANMKVNPERYGYITSFVTISTETGKQLRLDIETIGTTSPFDSYTKIAPNKKDVADACGGFLGNRNTKSWSDDQKIGAMMEEFKLPAGTPPTDPGFIARLEGMAKEKRGEWLGERLSSIESAANIRISASEKHQNDPGSTRYDLTVSSDQASKLREQITKIFKDAVGKSGQKLSTADAVKDMSELGGLPSPQFPDQKYAQQGKGAQLG